MSEFLHLIDREKLPRHIAVIMDGNGRWAKKHGRSRIFGHKNGVQAVKNTTESCAELGIDYLTLFAFSTENWQRPEFEVNALMALLVDTLNKEIKTLNKNDIRLKAIGDVEKLPKKTYLSLMEGIRNTQNNQRMTLTLALNYSSRWEITKALKSISKLVESGTIDPGMINEEFIEKHLETYGIPDPELLIRTSGERRISNFLLWQIAYTELYFTEKFWPDFKKEDLYEAIVDFQHRERRFGKISEQIRV
mgnify:CR=1 FL=1